MKRTFVLLTALAVFGALSLTASAAPNGAALTIKHQVRGCHAWSLNGGATKVVQVIHLTRGGSLVVRNNDVMPQQLVKTSGPRMIVKVISPGMMSKGMMKHPSAPGMMGRMGATLKVTFPATGVYRLTTKAGEDYFEVGPTIGEDNVLRAIVTVS